MPNVDTSFDPNARITTRIDRDRLDVGPPPDFWGDLDKMIGKLRDVGGTGRAGSQGVALRSAPQSSYAPPYIPYSARRQPQPSGNWGPQYTARSFARPQMTQHGVWGNYVNPIDVPLELQGLVPTGFFADDVMSNYTYSPLVDPARYGQPAGGAGGGRR